MVTKSNVNSYSYDIVSYRIRCWRRRLEASMSTSL